MSPSPPARPHIKATSTSRTPVTHGDASAIGLYEIDASGAVVSCCARLRPAGFEVGAAVSSDDISAWRLIDASEKDSSATLEAFEPEDDGGIRRVRRRPSRMVPCAATRRPDGHSHGSVDGSGSSRDFTIGWWSPLEYHPRLRPDGLSANPIADPMGASAATPGAAPPAPWA